MRVTPNLLHALALFESAAATPKLREQEQGHEREQEQGREREQERAPTASYEAKTNSSGVVGSAGEEPPSSVPRGAHRAEKAQGVGGEEVENDFPFRHLVRGDLNAQEGWVRVPASEVPETVWLRRGAEVCIFTRPLLLCAGSLLLYIRY